MVKPESCAQSASGSDLLRRRIAQRIEDRDGAMIRVRKCAFDEEVLGIEPRIEGSDCSLSVIGRSRQGRF